MTARYRIVLVYRAGHKRWLVYDGAGEIEGARFALKREAIAWIVQQEATR